MYPVTIWLSLILQEEWWGHPKNGVVVGHSMFAKLSYPVKIAKVINYKKKNRTKMNQRKKQNKNNNKQEGHGEVTVSLSGIFEHI